MSKVISAVLPIAGAVLGSIALPGLGTGIGAGLGGAIGGAAGGLGSAILSGGNFGTDLLGAAAGGLGGYFAGPGIASIGAGGAGAGALSITQQGVTDPIQAISNAMTATGTSTATEAATALGYPSTNAMLAAANPAWLTTPAALQGQVANATGGILGGAKAPQLGSFTGTVGSAPNAQASLLQALGGKTTALGPLSSMMSIGSGIYGLTEAQKMQQLAGQMAASNTYSPEASAQLKSLLSNPNSITSMPGYEAGMTAVERSMAAQGYQGSGNMAAALQQYGGNFYNQQVQQLQGLAQGGAQTTAGAAGVQAMGNQAASSALAALGYGATGLGF